MLAYYHIVSNYGPGINFFQANFLPRLLNETGHCTRPAFVYLISNLHTLMLNSPALSLMLPSAYFTDSSLKGTLIKRFSLHRLHMHDLEIWLICSTA